jgi:hypothetical protein
MNATQVTPVQNATGSAAVGPVTQIAPSGTVVLRWLRIVLPPRVEGAARSKGGSKDKQPRKSKKARAPSATVTQAL